MRNCFIFFSDDCLSTQMMTVWRPGETPGALEIISVRVIQSRSLCKMTAQKRHMHADVVATLNLASPASLGPGDTVSKSYDSASKDFVASFASRSHCCLGSVSWWFCIQRGGERNHANWLSFLLLWRRCADLLSWVSLTAYQFVFWAHWGNDCQNTPGARPFCSCRIWHCPCLESWN